MLADAGLIEIVADKYGLGAFGVVVLIIVVALIVTVWKKVAEPAMNIRLAIEKEQTTQTQALERMQRAAAELLPRLEHLVKDLEQAKGE